MATRDELLARVGARYRVGSRGEKGRILAEFLEVSGYCRKHAERLLRAPVRADRSAPRPERRLYDEAVRQALIVLWESSDRICSKRLKPLLPMLVTSMERHGHLSLDADVRTRVLTLSASTIDRILSPVRAKAGLSRHRRNPPSMAIRRSIPVRTFSDWNDPLPGFMEVDLVAHSGPSCRGSYIQTLVMTDVASGWTECAPLLFREQTLLSEVMTFIAAELPFPLLGFDSDNDSVFMNETIKSWCETAKVTFTRSRPYRKNDQAHVEQKNGAIVRRTIGYRRYEGQECVLALRALYRSLRLFVNFFQPSFKLLEVSRDGAAVRKRYHPPMTPHQRLSNDPRVSSDIKTKLNALYSELDPVKLLADIRAGQAAIVTIADRVAGAAPKFEQSPLLDQRGQELEAFLSGLRTAWKEGEVRPTARSKPKAPRGRRRPDPLKDVTDELMVWFADDPSLTGRQLLEKAQAARPGRYPNGLVRTVQRRLKVWRASRANLLVFGESNPRRPVGSGNIPVEASGRSFGNTAN
jgi:hypothetical protein